MHRIDKNLNGDISLQTFNLFGRPSEIHVFPRKTLRASIVNNGSNDPNAIEITKDGERKYLLLRSSTFYVNGASLSFKEKREDSCSLLLEKKKVEKNWLQTFNT